MNTKINEILQEIESVIVGKNEIVEKILMAILAQGHVLMEDCLLYTSDAADE